LLVFVLVVSKGETVILDNYSNRVKTIHI